MSRIVIGFSRAKGFKLFSKFVMLFEKTNYSHVFIKVYNSEFGDYDIYQASKGMVNHVLETSFLEKNIVVQEFAVNVPEVDKLSAVNFLRTRLGKPYSFLSLAIIFLRRFGISLRSFSDGEKAYICSELAALLLNNFVLKNLKCNLDLVTPKQLHYILQNLKE
jgi:hypothetical protein